MSRQKKLAQGKLPIDVLKPVLQSIAAKDLVVAPDIGIDVGITRSNGKYIVSSSDPITGVVDRIGWYAVNVSANDVSTSGIPPNTLNVVALFPEGTNEKQITHVMGEISETAAQLGISVAGGHTEITPRLDRPIIMVTAIGSGDSFVTAGDAKEGDSILLTKTAGIEGSSILAKLPAVAKMLDARTREKAQGLIQNLSVLKDANVAFQTGMIHAMHDVTEGGVVGSLLEMSIASKLGFTLFRDKVPIDPSTAEISSKLKIDPLRLIGSGSLLIACAKENSDKVITKLKGAKVLTTEVGTFLPSVKDRWLESGIQKERLSSESVQDELWPLLSKYRDLP